jgi:hypothetical protein
VSIYPLIIKQFNFGGEGGGGGGGGEGGEDGQREVAMKKE